MQPSMALNALRTLALSLTLAATAGPAAAQPVAAVKNVPTTLHGTVVDDPYRWLEDVKAPATLAWLKAQGAHARGVLDRIDGRDAIERQLASWAAAQGDAVRDLQLLPGERFYYLKRNAGERQFKLVMRQGAIGAERVLVDPEVVSRRTGVPHAINYYRPSWDGRTLAYGLSGGGSEDASLYLQDIASGRAIGRPVSRVPEALLHWLPDSSGFSYNRFQTLPPGAPETDAYKDSRVLLQALKGGAAREIFGPTVAATRGLQLDRLDVGQMITVPGSRWAVIRTTDTTVPEGKLFVAALADVVKGRAAWRRIASEADQVVDVALRGDELVVMTQRGAPRRRIVGVDLAQPLATLADAQLLVAEPADGPLQQFQLTPGGLVASVQRGTAQVLRRYARGDSSGRELAQTTPGSTSLAEVPAHDTEALPYRFSAWTEAGRWLRLDAARPVEAAPQALDLGRRAVPEGLPAVTVTEVLVPSHDGVKVPMTVLHRQGLKLDGSNPVLLEGYASYGSTISARFSVVDMAWLARGGVLAYTNPRGSGVYGDGWHRAGFKDTKPNTWLDGIACARWLIDQGYGSARTMGISGTSAGGIFVGRAVTAAPELFAAAIFNVGMLDAVRAEDSANGATNISEFGSVKDAEGFKALLAMSTYHQISDGKAYPGVLLVHGLNDPRVDVWNSAKTAARLQAAQAGVAAARPVLLRLDAQAGHGMGSTLNQRLAEAADSTAFLLWQMGVLKLKD